MNGCKAATAFSIRVLFFFYCLCFSFVSPQVIKHPTQPIISFATGGTQACAVFNTKKMKCWGYKVALGMSETYFGDNLGDELIELGDSLPYIDVGNETEINQVICGGGHICIKLDTGNLKCLGENGLGQTGLDASLPTVVVGSVSGHIGDKLPIVNLGTGFVVSGVAAGAVHTCVLSTIGKVKCMGGNSAGQLGYGNTTSKGLSSSEMGDNLPYVDFGANVEVSFIYSGVISSHNCVILSKPTLDAQKIKCWGTNEDYELGYGAFFGSDFNRGDAEGEMGDNLPLVDLGTESRVKQLALGKAHTCALLTNDALKCFGANQIGQLGLGSVATISSTGNALPFVPIDVGKTIKLVTAGDSHTCILYDDMTSMKCFGRNNAGQLGQGDSISRGYSQTTTIPNITAINLGTGSLTIASIHGGQTFTCVVIVDNSVKCFGGNDFGQLAIGTAYTVGDSASQMGNNLKFAELFSPTTSPTKSPSRNPTLLPTSTPTKQCDYASAKLCKYDFKCTWKKVNDIKQCVVFDCTTLNKGKCGKERTKCKWNKSTSSCGTKKNT